MVFQRMLAAMGGVIAQGLRRALGRRQDERPGVSAMDHPELPAKEQPEAPILMPREAPSPPPEHGCPGNVSLDLSAPPQHPSPEPAHAAPARADWADLADDPLEVTAAASRRVDGTPPANESPAAQEVRPAPEPADPDPNPLPARPPVPLPESSPELVAPVRDEGPSIEIADAAPRKPRRTRSRQGVAADAAAVQAEAPAEPLRSVKAEKKPARRKASGAASAVPPPEPPAAEVLPKARKRKPAASAGGALRPVCDPEVEALTVRIAAVEARLTELSGRKTQMEESILAYQLAQYHALGATLETCMGLRLDYLRRKAERSGSEADRQAAEAAQADHEACHQQAAEDAGLEKLDAAGRDELKQLYRAAAMRCHPDRVGEARREAAQATFLRLQKAYRSGDLAALRTLSLELEGEGAGARQPSASAEAPALRKRLSDLQDAAGDLILALQTAQLDPLYRKAVHPDAWEAEFAETRQHLEAEIDQLRREIRRMR